MKKHARTPEQHAFAAFWASERDMLFRFARRHGISHSAVYAIAQFVWGCGVTWQHDHAELQRKGREALASLPTAAIDEHVLRKILANPSPEPAQPPSVPARSLPSQGGSGVSSRARTLLADSLIVMLVLGSIAAALLVMQP